MIKLAVFDWNGTLLADFLPVFEGANKELEVFDLPPISPATFRDAYEIPFTNALLKLGVNPTLLKEKSDEASRAFHAYYEPRAAKAHTRRGARAMLDILHDRNISRIILSNHTIVGINEQLERLMLSHHFEDVLANADITTAHHNGKQHRLEAYLKTSGIKSSEAVIIGDTVEEIIIGRNLELKTIAITGGHCSTKRLKEMKPDLIISSLHDIKDKLEDIQ